MSQELLNHKTKCRLCFQRVSVIRNCSRISEKIRQKFLSLTNIELKLSDSFSNSICKSCIKSLSEWSEFQQKMIDNQQRLYAFEGADKFVVKIEPIELDAIELQEIDIGDFLPKTEVFDDTWVESRKPEFENDVAPPSPAVDDWITAPEFNNDQDHQAYNDEVAASEDKPKKGGRANYPKEQLYNAVEAVALGELTAGAASKKFGVPKATVLRNFHKDYYLLTDEEEFQVKLYVNKRTESGIATTDDDIGKFILFRLLSKRRGKDRVKIKKLSSMWVSMFRKRHSDMNVLNESNTASEFSCDICGFSINDKRKLRKHMSLHVVEVHYPEQYSKITVRSNPEALEKAMQAVAGGLSVRAAAKLHKTPETTLRRYRQKRSRPEDEPEIFKCSFCEKAFFSESSVRSHEMKQHLTPVGEFPCEECGKVYSTKANLRAHVRVAHLIGTFRCTRCSEEFKTHREMDSHRRIHRVDVACEICGKLLINGRGYTQHLKSHTTQAIKCPFEGCSKEFRGKSSLQYHIENSHTPSQDLKCPKCSSTFPNSRRLKIHDERSHAEARFFCEVDGCNYKNTRKEYLKLHLRNHRDIDVKHRDELIAKLDDKV